MTASISLNKTNSGTPLISFLFIIFTILAPFLLHLFPLSLSSTIKNRGPNSRDIKERLELLDQQPLVITYVRPIEFLQCVDARAADQ